MIVNNHYLSSQPTRPWKTAAFSEIKRRNIYGYSIRTEQYRYTEWGPDGSRGRELYNYDVDPNETVNVVDLPENAERVELLSEQLHAGWQAALPDTQQQRPVPETLPWDINNDRVVDIRDLILVSNSFGMETLEHPKVDVNKDGRVDIIDLLLVAAHFGESNGPASPPTRLTEGKKMIVNNHGFSSDPKQLRIVEQWLTEARLVDDGSDVFREGIATLEHLIYTTVPPETALLPNYPNPFNPETWIPYDLAEDADVSIDIYNLNGEPVRRLSLGFQTAGTYRTPDRAAYWDGRNVVGEPVASGTYFYTFQAGKFRTTRQMAIVK